MPGLPVMASAADDGPEGTSAPCILYGMTSPNVTKVSIMLEETGTAYELRHVAVFKGEQFDADFRALNPLAKVPVLVDPRLGAPIAESGAILFWLSERSGMLLPAEGADRYAAMQWLMVQMSAIGPMFGQLNHFRLLPPGSEPYATGRYAALAERLYRVLDERLATREWIAGDAYSIADVATYPWANYLEQHGFDPQGHPALLRWRDAIAARPAVMRAVTRGRAAFGEIATSTRQAATPDDLDRFFGRTAAMPVADYSSAIR